MENTNKNEEINQVIDKVAQKFSYDDELKNVLKRIIPSVIKIKGPEFKELIYDTLNRVKIVVFDEDPTLKQLEDLKKEFFSEEKKYKDIGEDMGEYGKGISPAAYITEAVYDDDLNIVDRNAFLYVTRLNENNKLAKIYGTTINLSYMIHEFGHAVAAQNLEYIQNPDDTATTVIGTCRINYEIDKEKREIKQIGYDGLLMEECLNSIDEEDILCDVLDVKSIEELISKGYVKSVYQNTITPMMRAYVEKFGKEAFNQYRYYGNTEAISEIEECLKNTQAWETITSKEYNDRKREKMAQIEQLDISEQTMEKIKSFLAKYDEVYFADNSKFTPIQKLENVFTQVFNFKDIRYSFNIIKNEKNFEIYKNVQMLIQAEGYVPKNQADIEKIKNKHIDENSKEFESQDNTFFKELQDGVYAKSPDIKNGILRNHEKNKEKRLENTYNKEKKGEKCI